MGWSQDRPILWPKYALMSSANSELQTAQPVHFVPDLPRNTMGKVQKNILRHTYNSIYQSQA